MDTSVGIRDLIHYDCERMSVYRTIYIRIDLYTPYHSRHTDAPSKVAQRGVSDRSRRFSLAKETSSKSACVQPYPIDSFRISCAKCYPPTQATPRMTKEFHVGAQDE